MHNCLTAPDSVRNGPYQTKSFSDRAGFRAKVYKVVRQNYFEQYGRYERYSK